MHWLGFSGSRLRASFCAGDAQAGVPHPPGAQSTRDGEADLYISDFSSVENSMADMPRVNGNADRGIQTLGRGERRYVGEVFLEWTREPNPKGSVAARQDEKTR